MAPLPCRARHNVAGIFGMDKAVFASLEDPDFFWGKAVHKAGIVGRDKDALPCGALPEGPCQGPKQFVMKPLVGILDAQERGWHWIVEQKQAGQGFQRAIRHTPTMAP